MSDEITLPIWHVQFDNGETTEFYEEGSIIWNFNIAALKAASYHVKNKFCDSVGWSVTEPLGRRKFRYTIESLNNEYKLFDPISTKN